jgi:hypothetical protein
VGPVHKVLSIPKYFGRTQTHGFPRGQAALRRDRPEIDFVYSKLGLRALPVKFTNCPNFGDACVRLDGGPGERVGGSAKHCAQEAEADGTFVGEAVQLDAGTPASSA